MMYDPKWITRYMNLAKEIADWSKDPSTKVGAVLVGSDRQILSQGYNGFPRGVSDDEARYLNREQKYKLIVHAEMNSILNAALSGTRLDGATLFVYGLPPCCECTKAIIQSGIREVFYSCPDTFSEKWKESLAFSSTMMEEAGVTLKRYHLE